MSSVRSGAREVTKMRPSRVVGLLNGLQLALWGPALGKRFVLRRLYVRASVAGEYLLLDQATTIGYLWVPANTWGLVLDLSTEVYGYQSLAPSNELRLQNNTGGAVELNCLCVGHEE